MILIIKIVLALILAFIIIDFALVVVYHKKKLTKSKTVDSNICESANGVANCAPAVNHKNLTKTTLTDK